ncbi:MAG: hypothetical protein WC959_04725 [Kiritimatiellales bacterium]
MRSTLRFVLAVLSIAALGAPAAQIISLTETEAGNYWYMRQVWLGGSYTDDGFSYGDAGTGLIHAQRYYEYYGGSDRIWESKSIYFQIDLSSLAGQAVDSAIFNFHVAAYNTPAESYLRHLETQVMPAAGDAGQQLSGDVDVIGTHSFTLGWNAVDLTAQIQSDLAKGYAYTVLSIPEFSQVEGENRILSIYGASTTVTEGGVLLRPYLSVIPEPHTFVLLTAGAVMLRFYRRKK